jgi:hypothetical protein
LYLRQNGNDGNDGTSAQQAVKTLARLNRLLKPNTTAFVGPGRYTGRLAINGLDGTATAPVAVRADPNGDETGDSPGDVILDAAGDVVNVLITRSTHVTVDGFSITGAAPRGMPDPVSATAVTIRTASANITISNCAIINTTTADGVRIDGSSDVLLFNTLILGSDRGILVTGDVANPRLISNTIASSERTGIVLTQSGGLAPRGTTVLNNVIQENGNLLGITASEGPPSSLSDYRGDHNLVFEPEVLDPAATYRPPTIQGEHDVNDDALFVDLSVGDAHLAEDSPAIDAGTDDIGDELRDALLERSTSEDGGRDRPPLDLGYHYPR